MATSDHRADYLPGGPVLRGEHGEISGESTKDEHAYRPVVIHP